MALETQTLLPKCWKPQTLLPLLKAVDSYSVFPLYTHSLFQGHCYPQYMIVNWKWLGLLTSPTGKMCLLLLPSLGVVSLLSREGTIVPHSWGDTLICLCASPFTCWTLVVVMLGMSLRAELSSCSVSLLGTNRISVVAFFWDQFRSFSPLYFSWSCKRSSHHFYPCVLYQRRRVLCCYIPGGNNTSCLASPQYEKDRVGWQVCIQGFQGLLWGCIYAGFGDFGP